MSEIKQEILDLLILNGRKPQIIKSGERVVYLYDALNIVNKEFSKTEQPQLNENQQIVLEWLKNIYNSPIGINPIAVFFALHNELVKDSEIDAVEAYEELEFEEEIQVLEVFSQWAKEQEAE